MRPPARALCLCEMQKQTPPVVDMALERKESVHSETDFPFDVSLFWNVQSFRVGPFSSSSSSNQGVAQSHTGMVTGGMGGPM